MLFLVWAVPNFRDPTFASGYYEQWQATTTDNQLEQGQNPRTWVRGLRGRVYTEDTAAQWLMVLLGISATVVSLLALIWLKATWAETKRSADAAERAADIAREIGQAQVRAYVTVANGELSVDDTYCQVWIEFENKGQSPAFNVVARVSAIIRPLLSIHKSPFEVSQAPAQECVCEMISAGGVGRGFILFSHTVFEATAFDNLVDSRANISFQFRMTWRDVFNVEHALVGFLDPRNLAHNENPPAVESLGRRGSKHWTAWLRPYIRDQRQNDILNAQKGWGKPQN